jgi:hypothetical protein
MAQPAHKSASTRRAARTPRKRSPIPEPFHVVAKATVARDAATIDVPMLVIYGEWLKAAGFPIGASAYLTTDKRGELAISRLGLGAPRRLRVRSTPR